MADEAARRTHRTPSPAAQPLHHVVAVTEQSFVVVGPFETGAAGQAWIDRQLERDAAAPLIPATAYHLILPVPPKRLP